jgi:hypothetical protein
MRAADLITVTVYRVLLAERMYVYIFPLMHRNNQ